MRIVRKKQGRRRAPVWAGAFVGCLLLMCCPGAMALDPSLDVNQYGHTAWRVRDGFFKGKIFAMAQTSDGYLWLGTEFGLFRFDGVRVVPWQPPAGQHLPDNWVRALVASRDGTLWIGTLKGLAGWKDGKLTEYPELTEAIVNALLEDRQGAIWVGAGGVVSASGRLCSIRAGAMECHGEDGRFGQGITDLYEDGAGTLWAAAANGLWRWRPGPPKLYPMRDPPSGLQPLAEGDSGSILVATSSGVRQFADGKFKPYSAPGTSRGSSRLFRDRDGGLWIGPRDKALVHVHQGKTDVFGTSDGLSGDDISRFFEDRERNIWISTADGLDLFREIAVRTLTLKQGLLSRVVVSVLADKDGTVWLGTFGGLNRWERGEITTPSTGGAKRDGKVNGLDPDALFRDDRGRLWISTARGLGYLQSDRFVPIDGIPIGAVHAIVEDKGSNLWVATEPFGLFRLNPSDGVQAFPSASLGHKDFPTTAAVDPLRDGLWIGFFQGGITYFSGGQIRESYSSADGLGDGYISEIRVDPDGTVWAATKTGLSRLKNGRITTLTSRNGLPCDAVHWSIEDDDHSLWLYTACGLLRIAQPDMEAWATDPKHTVAPAVFDNSDGVRVLAFPIGYSPKVAKSPDGKLWFLPSDGASILDPHHLAMNNLPPPVQVEQITADHKVSWQNSWGDASAGVHLPAQVRDLEIDYTALSFVEPEKVHFRYKLEGWDREWQWVGNRRQAFYTNLSPGNYRFRVAASNNSGVWNEDGASLDFSVAPAYYQTWWFRSLCVVAFLALLWALYQLRLRHLQREFEVGLEARVGERTRIARELHDTLLQSFQGLLLHFQAGVNLVETRPQDAKQKLKNALDMASDAIAEGRDAVQGLRSSTKVTNDIALAVDTCGRELAGNELNENCPEFRVDVEGAPRDLHPILRDEVCQIACEALRNAFKHAQANRIEVEIHYDADELRVRIRDDGKGIEPKLVDGKAKPGHWGLSGMRERAKLIGGDLELWSNVQSGTEIELTIPAAAAYAKATTHRRSWFSKKGARAN